MGIKWLDKSHRSPVSCKEISCEQVANRSRSQCKQGFSEPLCEPNINCFLYEGLRLNIGRMFARSGGCP